MKNSVEYNMFSCNSYISNKLTKCSHMTHIVRKPVSGSPTRSDINRAVKLQKMARGLKFRIWEVEGYIVSTIYVAKT